MGQLAPSNWAQRYVERGWSILPLHSIDESGKCTCRNFSCSSPGKHPRTANGVKDATTDQSKIEQWFTNWPEANIGIATGEKSGLVVLDIDPRNGGDDTLTSLLELHGPLPHTVKSLTGGGGAHYLFAYEEGLKGKLGLGIDIKSDGGYIVAPPSRHISGHVYSWEVF